VTRDNSPTYRQGLEDGAADCALASSCPPGTPLGPMPPFPAYPVMYMAGYGEAYNPAPCPCDGSCRRGRQYGEAPDSARGGRDVLANHTSHGGRPG
jgi:hypothetical protein